MAFSAKVFDWAKFRQYTGAVKIHMVLNYQGYMPHFLSITDGKIQENKKSMSILINALRLHLYAKI
jgi:hypothetical protein